MLGCSAYLQSAVKSDFGYPSTSVEMIAPYTLPSLSTRMSLYMSHEIPF